MRYYYGSEEALDYHQVNEAVEAVFREHARGHVQMPPKVYITFDHGDFRTMPAYVPALGIAGVKIVNPGPASEGHCALIQLGDEPRDITIKIISL
jgi:alanine dehydrogenase